MFVSNWSEHTMRILTTIATLLLVTSVLDYIYSVVSHVFATAAAF